MVVHVVMKTFLYLVGFQYESDSLEWCEATCFLFLVILGLCNKVIRIFPSINTFLLSFIPCSLVYINCSLP
jgi:hypothetical protein